MGRYTTMRKQAGARNTPSHVLHICRKGRKMYQVFPRVRQANFKSTSAINVIKMAVLLPVLCVGETFGDAVGFQVDSGSIYSFNVSSGAEVSWFPISGSEHLSGLTFDPASGLLFAIDGYNDHESDRLFQIDPRTGEGTVIGSTGLNWNFRFLEFDSMSQELLAGTDNELFKLDPDSGTATFLTSIRSEGSPFFAGQLTSMAIDPTDGNMYFAAITGGDGSENSLHRVDRESGLATLVGISDVENRFWDDLGFTQDGVLFASAYGGEVFKLDKLTAAATSAYSLPTQGNGLAFSSVPEPSSAISLLLGVLFVFRFYSEARSGL